MATSWRSAHGRRRRAPSPFLRVFAHAAERELAGPRHPGRDLHARSHARTGHTRVMGRRKRVPIRSGRFQSGEVAVNPFRPFARGGAMRPCGLLTHSVPSALTTEIKSRQQVSQTPFFGKCGRLVRDRSRILFNGKAQFAHHASSGPRTDDGTATRQGKPRGDAGRGTGQGSQAARPDAGMTMRERAEVRPPGNDEDDSQIRQGPARSVLREISAKTVKTARERR